MIIDVNVLVSDSVRRILSSRDIAYSSWHNGQCLRLTSERETDTCSSCPNGSVRVLVVLAEGTTVENCRTLANRPSLRCSNPGEARQKRLFSRDSCLYRIRSKGNGTWGVNPSRLSETKTRRSLRQVVESVLSWCIRHRFRKEPFSPV